MNISLAIDEQRHTLAAAVGDAAHQWSERRSLIVSIDSGDGIRGAGEAAPLPGRSIDSIDDARRALEACGAVHLDRDMSVLRALDAGATHELAASPSARFALESAALDWLACARGLQLHEAIAEACGGDVVATPVPIAALVADPPVRWLERARSLARDGFETVKFKVGSSWERELTTLETVRAELPTLTLRLDANRALIADDFARSLSRLQAIGIEFIEEPVPPDDLGRFEDSPVPLAIDETLLEESKAHEALRFDAVVAAVLKPTLLGGIRATYRWAKRAAEHGVDAVVSHALEGMVGMRACAALAIALQGTRAAGLGLHGALPAGALDALPVFAGPRLDPAAARGVAR